MAELVDASALDLARATRFIHYIRPSLQDKLVYGIEKVLPFDRSIVFHLTDRKRVDDNRETSIFMLSADYILEHPYWKGLEND